MWKRLKTCTWKTHRHACGSALDLHTGGGVGYAYGITNIEYTEFKQLGIRDEAQCEGSHLSVFPANTNVLYLGLKVCDCCFAALRSRLVSCHTFGAVSCFAAVEGP